MSFPKYPRYKNSGVEWLGEVPEHWEVTRLRFAVTINPSKTEAAHLDPATDVSFLPMEAIGEDGMIDLERQRKLSEVQSGYTYFRDGDVVVAKITPCFENGKGAVAAGLANGIGFGTTELIVARPVAGRMDGRFLDYLFRSREFRALGEAQMYGAGGQKRVPDSFVRDFATGLPPFGEQGAVSAFLDRETAKIDGLISEQQRLIEILKEKRQAVISHAVTRGLNPDAPMKPSGVEWLGDVPAHWTVCQLGKLCRAVSDGPHFSPPYVDDGVPFLSARNVKVDRWDFSDVKHIAPELCDEFDRRVTPEMGDILYTKGGTTGIARVVDLEYRFQVWVHIAVLKIHRNAVDPQFLAYALNSSGSYEQSQLHTRGATNQDLGLTRMIRIMLTVPPTEEQLQIVRHLNDQVRMLDTLLLEAERAITLLKERRTALISAAVTGKIDVRGIAMAEAA